MTIKFTKTFEIDENGDCQKCPSCVDMVGVSYCNAFMDAMFYRKTRGNLPACKDFLIIEKSKVYCSKCNHLSGDIKFGFLEPDCAKSNEIKEDNENGYYCLNCQDRSES